VTSGPARLRALRALARHDAELGKRELKADINVTPLVDVVLVLLIIFMVVTPLIASGVAVDLPRTANHSRKPDEGKDVILSVTSDKRIYMGSTRVSGMRDLAEQVAVEKRRFPEKTIFLKADARVPYGTVREVMEALHGAEIEDIVLGTEELQAKR
jgi:biopolymer transport protein TolR